MVRRLSLTGLKLPGVVNRVAFLAPREKALVIRRHPLGQPTNDDRGSTAC